MAAMSQTVALRCGRWWGGSGVLLGLSMQKLLKIAGGTQQVAGTDIGHSGFQGQTKHQY